jgi:ECF sigma factor
MSEQAPSPEEITRILHAWRDGSREALDRLIPLVYDELSTLASRQLAREWRHGRMQTTAVVNVAYVKLFNQREIDWQNRGHFFAIAAQLMRRILVDHARSELRGKRGGAAFISRSTPPHPSRRPQPWMSSKRRRSIARSRSSNNSIPRNPDGNCDQRRDGS